MGNETKETSLMLEGIKQEKRRLLYPDEAETVLARYGIGSVVGAYCENNLDALSQAAERIGFPVVLKLISQDILHKSDAGYIKPNINGMDALARAHHDILQK